MKKLRKFDTVVGVLAGVGLVTTSAIIAGSIMTSRDKQRQNLQVLKQEIERARQEGRLEASRKIETIPGA